MKRKILFIAVIALVAVAVFGGQALAARTTGSPVAMETRSGYAHVSEDTTAVVGGTYYPDVRHVSLTLKTLGIDTYGDHANIWMFYGATVDTLSTITTNNVTVYEFDTDNWQLAIKDVGGDPLEVWYHITMTYPR
jgi:hypothetical protein